MRSHENKNAFALRESPAPLNIDLSRLARRQTLLLLADDLREDVEPRSNATALAECLELQAVWVGGHRVELLLLVAALGRGSSLTSGGGRSSRAIAVARSATWTKRRVWECSRA